MAVRAVSTAPRCKLCQTPHRASIDLLLERRSKGETDEVTGRRFNFGYVKELVEAMGVPNLTEENVKVHWKKHCEVISDAAEERAAEVHERMKAELPEDATLEQKIAWATRLFENQTLARIEAGEDPGLTWDQYIKLLGLQSQRKQDEAQQALFKSLGAGLQMALAKGDSKPALPAADIEVEATEEAEEAEVVA